VEIIRGGDPKDRCLPISTMTYIIDFITYALVPRSEVLTLAYVPRIYDVPTRAYVPISVALTIAEVPISSVPTYVLVPSSDA
jgi:hypothetical protein